jgi:tetratricopeptide (TPR) repeat protein
MSLRVAVITPYFRTPDAWLSRCHHSVAEQSYKCTHILVADGEPQAIANSFNAQHIVLPVCHRDYGDTPRGIGGLSAIGQAFDAIAYLDADNWYARDHIASLIDAHMRTGAAVCTARRTIHHLDGRQMGFQVNPDQYDTSCLMLFRSALQMAAEWALIPEDFHAIDDFVIWCRLMNSRLSRADTGRYTVAYRMGHVAAYRSLSWPVPEGARDINNALTVAHERWVAEGNPAAPELILVATAQNNNDRGIAWARLGRYDKAVQAFDKAIKQNPNYVEAHRNRGGALARLSRYDEALASFRRALEIHPNHAVGSHKLSLA